MSSMPPHSTEYESQNSLIPHPNDFIFGKGGAKHPGNIMFHQLIAANKAQYRSNIRGERNKLAYQIYAKMKDANPPNRFLIRDSKCLDRWLEVDKSRAIIKISQSLSDERRKPQSKKAIVSSSLSNKVDDSKKSTGSHSSSLFLNQSKNDLQENLKLKSKQLQNKSSIINDQQKEAKTVGSCSNEILNLHITSDTSTNSSETSFSGFEAVNDTSYYPILHDNVVSASNKISDCPDSEFDSKVKDQLYVLKQSMMRSNTKTDFVGSDTYQVRDSNSEYMHKKFDKAPTRDRFSANENAIDIVENCIMSLSCIGQSFLLNEKKAKEDSIRMYIDLAEIQSKEKHAIFYLPSIIGGLCKRISDLEKKLQV